MVMVMLNYIHLGRRPTMAAMTERLWTKPPPFADLL
jgi:hypothetical protein